jgi:hypothetical protein
VKLPTGSSAGLYVICGTEGSMEFFHNTNLISFIQVICWLLAGVFSFYFSIGNARVWTSISLGFFLIFISQLYLLAPWVDYTELEAIHYIIGTISIMVMTHGFLEYYVFSRTMEVGGSKMVVYLSILGIIVGSVVFVVINPSPTYVVLRNIKMIENSTWVFLCIVNLELIRKIYLQIKGSAMSNGFVAFGIVFVFIFLWKGSELYLQVYSWDNDWQVFLTNVGVPSTVDDFRTRIAFSRAVSDYAGILSGLSVGSAFLYLYRLLR